MMLTCLENAATDQSTKLRLTHNKTTFLVETNKFKTSNVTLVMYDITCLKAIWKYKELTLLPKETVTISYNKLVDTS